jgi:GntR family transcriptional repressor for pyruvate dehydrogenase complex
LKNVWLQPIQVERVSEVIENRIKVLILDGEIKPGDRSLTEKELSTQFGVSVVTVREALGGLETFGVIRKQRGRGGGIVVTEIESNSVLEESRT